MNSHIDFFHLQKLTKLLKVLALYMYPVLLSMLKYAYAIANVHHTVCTFIERLSITVELLLFVGNPA